MAWHANECHFSISKQHPSLYKKQLSRTKPHSHSPKKHYPPPYLKKTLCPLNPITFALLKVNSMPASNADHLLIHQLRWEGVVSVGGGHCLSSKLLILLNTRSPTFPLRHAVYLGDQVRVLMVRPGPYAHMNFIEWFVEPSPE